MKRNFFLLLFFAGLMVSCAPLSQEILRQVDEGLTLREVQKDPHSYLGKIVLWGGVIVETTNKQNETLIKVMQTELGYEKRPMDLDKSAGRFLVRYFGFLDPAIFKQGREVTIAGEVMGKEVLPLGTIQYAYPVIQAKEIHLWEQQQEYRPLYYAPGYYYEPSIFLWHRYPYWRHPYGW
jgi:outer membrane lipoprotein